MVTIPGLRGSISGSLTKLASLQLVDLRSTGMVCAARPSVSAQSIVSAQPSSVQAPACQLPDGFFVAHSQIEVYTAAVAPQGASIVCAAVERSAASVVQTGQLLSGQGSLATDQATTLLFDPIYFYFSHCACSLPANSSSSWQAPSILVWPNGTITADCRSAQLQAQQQGSTAAPGDSSKKLLTAGGVAGVVIGSTVFGALVMLLTGLLFAFRDRKQRERATPSTSAPSSKLPRLQLEMGPDHAAAAQAAKRLHAPGTCPDLFGSEVTLVATDVEGKVTTDEWCHEPWIKIYACMRVSRCRAWFITT